jgi:hypothetical protein
MNALKMKSGRKKTTNGRTKKVQGKMRDERWREEKGKKEGGVKSLGWSGEREREKKKVDDEKGIMALS